MQAAQLPYIIATPRDSSTKIKVRLFVLAVAAKAFGLVRYHQIPAPLIIICTTKRLHVRQARRPSRCCCCCYGGGGSCCCSCGCRYCCHWSAAASSSELHEGGGHRCAPACLEGKAEAGTWSLCLKSTSVSRCATRSNAAVPVAVKRQPWSRDTSTLHRSTPRRTATHRPSRPHRGAPVHQ